MSARTIRRAAEHKARKAARKAALANPAALAEPAVSIPLSAAVEVPEPGAPLPSLSEISPARLAANRANAQKSSGPVTAAGKAVSSQNRTLHGLARKNGPFTILVTEDRDAFARLKDALHAEYAPTTESEAILVLEMAESHWLAQRATRLQNSCFDPATGLVSDHKSFSLYLRYGSTHRRAFHTAMNQLLKLRADQRKAELGFEAQRLKTEKHEMQKEKHYWNVLRADGEATSRISRNSIDRCNARDQHPGFEAQFAADLSARGLKQSWDVSVAA